MPAALRWLLAVIATLLVPLLLGLILFRLGGVQSVGLAFSFLFGTLLASGLMFWFALGARLGGMDRVGLAIVLPILVLMLSWAFMRGSVEAEIEAARAAAPPVAVVGNDRDAHGCIGSAGYAWCARENACVRPWELAAERGFEGSPAAFQAHCDAQ